MRIAVISDEVFFDYPWCDVERATGFAEQGRALQQREARPFRHGHDPSGRHLWGRRASMGQGEQVGNHFARVLFGHRIVSAGQDAGVQGRVRHAREECV